MTTYAHPNISELIEHIELERKTFLRSGFFSEEDFQYIRSPEEAVQVLELLAPVLGELVQFAQVYPSLLALFEKDFDELREFIQRNNILLLAFGDEFLFPRKELMPILDEEGKLSLSRFESHLTEIKKYLAEKTAEHLKTQEFLRAGINFRTENREIKCQCSICQADFRNQQRDQVLSHGELLVSTAGEKISQALANPSGQNLEVVGIFQELKKALDKFFYNLRYRIKRSTLNKIEGQIKELVKEEFYYPAPRAKNLGQRLRPFFGVQLKKQGLRSDLLTETEFERFFIQLGSNLWRSESFLEAEFTKHIKSVLILKRKDISANILREYLGQFWLHADARRLNRKIIYHVGPTNSGKTYYAMAALCQAAKGCYLAPLRLLAAELYDTMNSRGVKTTLLTGEEVIEIEGATHYSSTVEMAKFGEIFDCCVIDEIQMMTDSQRGWAWTRALVNIQAKEVHVCGDATVLELVQQIVQLTGDHLEFKQYERMTPLEVESAPINAGALAKGDAVIVFSRKNALKYKHDLEMLDFKVSIIYGRLSPEVRREQARKFDIGETDIIVSTDAISMGMNLPIRRIVFTTLTKYVNSKEYPITASEIKQIAGRAGRFNRFPVGYVTALRRVESGIEQINAALHAQLPQQSQAMLGPDLEIFNKVNGALTNNGLPVLKLSEFLRLFNTMAFTRPFYCVDLKEMIELAETVEEADSKNRLSSSEVFGFACAPVNLGLMEHVQYYIWILNNYVSGRFIKNEEIDFNSNDIDYLETSIKCVELYQWLSRHFNQKNFEFSEGMLLDNKARAIEKLNNLLSEKITRSCSSCGAPLADDIKFNICDGCFKEKRFSFKRRPNYRNNSSGSGAGRPAPDRGAKKNNYSGKGQMSKSDKLKFQEKKKFRRPK